MKDDFEKYYFDAEQETKRERTKAGKARRKTQLTIVAVVFLTFVLCAFYIYVTQFAISRKVVDFYSHFPEYDRNVTYSVVGGKIIQAENNPVVFEGKLYLPASFIREYVDPYIFWEKGQSRLTVTTEKKVVRMRIEELTYFVNDRPFELTIPLYEIAGEAYLPASLAESLYEISISYQSEYKMAVVRFEGEETTAVAAEQIALRYESDRQGDIEYVVAKGAVVTVLEEYDKKAEFLLVRAENGLIGYARAKYLKDFVTKKVSFSKQQDVAAQNPGFDGRFTMVWDQIFNPDANKSESRRTPIDGLNVLSPTWFSFDKTDALAGKATVLNIADKGYVDWAHENGYKVWALLSDNFDSEISHAILTNPDMREYAIKQLLSFVSLYGLDGINIDFEQIREADSAFYIQFLRELAPLLKEQWAVTSVDMYAPAPHTKHYNRTEVGKAVDYVMIMAYDEYWATSPVSGPVASIGFVEKAIVNTLEEVPKEKVVLGIPFYTRIWTEKDGVAHSEAYGMTRPYEIFLENGAEFVWNDEVGCYYAEYDDEDGLHRLWLEDENSIALKLDLADKYDLAGVAAWKRNLDKDGIWRLVNGYK